MVTVKHPKWVEPVNIEEQDCPLFVLSDQSSGIMQGLIKWKTNSMWSHIMVMHRPGVFASQGNMYSETPLKRYMKKNSRLKFWKVKITKEQRKLLLDTINKELKAPFWKRWYDYPGIFGQALGLRWIQSRFGMYCSEREARHLSLIFDGIPKQPHPEDLDELFESRPNDFEIYGKWDGD